MFAFQNDTRINNFKLTLADNIDFQYNHLQLYIMYISQESLNRPG